MRFLDFLKESGDLFERLASPVYVNDSKTLYLVNNLIQKEFGIKSYEGSGGMCFLSQFIFSIASATGMSSQTIADVFKKQTDYHTGHSLDSLLKFFGNVDIPDGDKIHRLKLSFEKYSSVNEIIKAVKSGIPVTFITSAYHPIYRQFNDLEYGQDSKKDPGLIYGFTKYKSGNPVTKKVGEWAEKVFHALIFVGYDTQYKLLIGRESRSTYGYKGYFKLRAKELEKSFDQFACLAIIVDSIKTIDKPKPRDEDDEDKPIQRVNEKKPEERFKIGDKVLYTLGDNNYMSGTIKKLLHQTSNYAGREAQFLPGTWGYIVKNSKSSVNSFAADYDVKHDT